MINKKYILHVVAVFEAYMAKCPTFAIFSKISRDLWVIWYKK